MARPRLCFCPEIKFNPQITYFKPQGIPVAVLKIMDLSVEELEAMRLKNMEGLDQEKCAKKMHTSQSTFQRILSSAYKKVTQALVEGKAIEIVHHDTD
ncbi:MAG: DUF134 domain-containing protein [Patescibacteria group bacterium]|nr:DUF134 domain-containing protein [Patescibacteria group bacterium]